MTDPAYHRDRRLRLKANGTCVYCGVCPAEIGISLCNECRNKRNKKARLYYDTHLGQEHSRSRRYKDTHREEIKLRARVYFQSHHELCLERSRQSHKKMREQDPQRCREYERNRYHANPEHGREIGRRSYYNHLDKNRSRSRERSQKLRMEVLIHYSREDLRCSLCKEDDIRCLSIDHINGGGNRHRAAEGMQPGGLYRWLKNNHYPQGYQVLCMNCQWIKRYENNECHQGVSKPRHSRDSIVTQPVAAKHPAANLLTQGKT